MENKAAQTTSFLPSQRGAGGKLKKAPRRPPPTPYARPPQNQTQRGGRWLSKLVDPAFRLIAGGANLILPSLFSKSQSVNALPAPTDEKDNLDNLHAVVVGQNASGDDDDDDGDFTGNYVESRATELAGSSRVADRSNSHSDFNGHELNQKVDLVNPNGLSEIEKIMKDKRFSRDQINHLIEIIKSRAVDLPDIDQENKYLSTSAGNVSEPAVALEYLGKSTETKQEDLNRGIWETSKVKERKYLSTILEDGGRPANTLEYSRKYTEKKQEDLDRVIWKTPTPLMQSKLQDDIGTSPVEIARVYMENRISEVGFDTNSLMSKDEGTLPCSDELALKPFIPSPAPKSSPCWPGALVQDQSGYMTPQSQRGRFGLHSFPRTPYSRTIYSKTKSRLIQLQSNSDRHHNPMVTPFQQTQTPASGQVNSRGDALNDGHGSVGPIHRMRNKVNAYNPNPRGSAFSRISLNSHQVENFSVSEGLFSAPKRNLENGGTNNSAKFQSVGSKQSSEVSAPTVPAHSSLVARKILEHLERNPPTPKDKSVELRLATSRKKPLLSDPTIMTNKLNSLTHLGGLDYSEKSVQVHMNDPQDSANGVNVAVNNNTSSAPEMNVGTASTHFEYGGPSQDFRKALDSKLKNSHKDVSNSKVGLNAAGSELFGSQTKLRPQSSGTKPVLPTISINKPNQRWTISSDNSSGFTFPVSTTSGVSAEPPTPSIIPSSSSISLNKNEGSSIPAYSFGSRRSTPALVFSFPSTSNVPIHDASELKFKFGSDESTRISFSSIGKDAICY